LQGRCGVVRHCGFTRCVALGGASDFCAAVLPPAGDSRCITGGMANARLCWHRTGNARVAARQSGVEWSQPQYLCFGAAGAEAPLCPTAVPGLRAEGCSGCCGAVAALISGAPLAHCWLVADRASPALICCQVQRAACDLPGS
jgi:hypothetical protein